MNNFRDENLPPELGDIAGQLRDARHEATPIEMDQAKQRILQRASASARGARGARRTAWIRKPAFVTALLVSLSLTGGTAVAFPSFFSSLPLVAQSHAAPRITIPFSSGFGAGAGAVSIPNAASTQYPSRNPILGLLEAIFAFIAGLFR